MSGALVLMPSFQPGTGTRWSIRPPPAARSHGKPDASADLLTDRLGVRVRVRKAPKLRVHAEVGQLPLDELALHLGDFGLEDAAARRLTALVQVLLGVIKEVRREGVVTDGEPARSSMHSAISRSGSQCDFFELVGARKWKSRGSDSARAQCGYRDETGAGVEQRQVAEIAPGRPGSSRRTRSLPALRRAADRKSTTPTLMTASTLPRRIRANPVQPAERLDHVAADRRHFRRRNSGSSGRTSPRRASSTSLVATSSS